MESSPRRRGNRQRHTGANPTAKEDPGLSGHLPISPQRSPAGAKNRTVPVIFLWQWCCRSSPGGRRSSHRLRQMSSEPAAPSQTEAAASSSPTDTDGSWKIFFFFPMVSALTWRPLLQNAANVSLRNKRYQNVTFCFPHFLWWLYYIKQF